eukprot:TRINITY_DN361_c0_g1_i1.p1 TRINITY_DN361_c0_g1~~TRINITY_DN361_c0_g1_i1.p1  ORF type:complete len:130 (+),score=28.91 TRINITY_DN361_c0_g1_i1:30-392(+)
MTKNTPEEKKRSSSSKKKPSLPFSKRDLSKIVRFLKEKRIRLRDFEYDPDMDVLSMETSRRSVRRYLMLVNEIEGLDKFINERLILTHCRLKGSVVSGDIDNVTLTVRSQDIKEWVSLFH